MYPGLARSLSPESSSLHALSGPVSTGISRVARDVLGESLAPSPRLSSFGSWAIAPPSPRPLPEAGPLPGAHWPLGLVGLVRALAVIAAH